MALDVRIGVASARLGERPIGLRGPMREKVFEYADLTTGRPLASFVTGSMTPCGGSYAETKTIHVYGLTNEQTQC
jgi:hypothetical protein